MYKLFTLTAVLFFTAFGLTSCTDNTTDTQMNANRTVNDVKDLPNSNAMNSNMMSNTNKEVSSAGGSFMTAAAQGGMFEVKAGELASEKAANAEVKAFGKMMVEDHGKANAALKEVAAKQNVELPNELSGGQQADYDRLSKLSGAEFDKEYVDLMVKDHDEDLEAFQEQADDAENADLKTFAAKYAPIIKSHYEKIKAISDKMK